MGDCSNLPTVRNVLISVGAFIWLTSEAATPVYLACWGDSLTAGAGGTPYPTVLLSLSPALTVYNGGVGGYTSVQILSNEFLVNLDKLAWNHVLWSGRNDLYVVGTNVTIANIDATVSSIPKRKGYLVLSVLNASGEGTGTATHSNVLAINGYLEATYGVRYLDVRAHLIALYNPSDPQDVIDKNNDVPPTSLRSDAIHLNTAGYSAVASYIYTNLWRMSDVTITASNVTVGSLLQP